MLLAFFISEKIENGTISQYGDNSKALLKQMFEFAEQHDAQLEKMQDGEGEEGLSDIEETDISEKKHGKTFLQYIRQVIDEGNDISMDECHLVTSNITNFLSMFHLHLKV